MGKFVENSLVRDEKVIAMARMHWAIFLGPAVFIMIGLLFLEISKVVATVIFMIGIVLVIKAWVIRTNTELALTNKRVISKYGLIRRHNMDTNLDKIEGVSFNQGLLGRILGYGSVIIRGTGGDHQPVPYIADPMAFKNAVNGSMDL